MINSDVVFTHVCVHQECHDQPIPFHWCDWAAEVNRREVGYTNTSNKADVLLTMFNRHLRHNSFSDP